MTPYLLHSAGIATKSQFSWDGSGCSKKSELILAQTLASPEISSRAAGDASKKPSPASYNSLRFQSLGYAQDKHFL